MRSILGGNLQEAKEYAYQTGDTLTGSGTTIKSYVYGDSNWKDKLTSYNGNTITYDAIGNPLSYYNNWNFTWQKGRQLASAANGSDTVSYRYNESGIRTGKTVNGVTSIYTLEGELVKHEQKGTVNLWYYHDAEGKPEAMRMGMVLYLYRKNLQGDITGIYSGNTGELLVSYTYDAWGKPTITDVAGTTESANLAANNPYLYRGYRYDHETGLYYLHSRYYDPETGRFLNADVFLSTGDSSIACNMFAYCFNNPVNMEDQTGNWGEWIKSAVKWVADSIVKPVVTTMEKALAKVNITYSTGINISGSPSLAIVNLQGGISIDTKGNIALQGSFGIGVTSSGPSISVSSYHSMTTAPSVKELNGPSYQVGGSVGVLIEGFPAYFGGDFMLTPDPDRNTGYPGQTVNGGVGTPGGEGHLECSRTGTLFGGSFNVVGSAPVVELLKIRKEMCGNGTALNLDGTPSHEGRGTPTITNGLNNWLWNNGYGEALK